MAFPSEYPGSSVSRAFLLSKVACERGLRLVDHWRCGMTSALALESLGLLNLAEAQSGWNG